MNQTFYARTDADGYLACVSTRPEEGLSPLSLPDDYQWEWMHCYRLAVGGVELDAERRAACEAALPAGDMEARVAALEVLLPAQVGALQILGLL